MKTSIKKPSYRHYPASKQLVLRIPLHVDQPIELDIDSLQAQLQTQIDTQIAREISKGQAERFATQLSRLSVKQKIGLAWEMVKPVLHDIVKTDSASQTAEGQ